MELHSRVTQHIVDAAAALMRSDFASLQRYDTEHKALKLLNHYGLSDKSAQAWMWVSPESVTGCGESLRTGRRVLVQDIETCDFLTVARETYRACGIRSMQSTPLLGIDGQLIGMVSTHWRKPYRPSNHDFDLFDVWVQQTADVFILNQEMTAVLEQAEYEMARCRALVQQFEELRSIRKQPLH